MKDNKGKVFEQQFKEGWQKAFPNQFIYRLADQVTGYKVTSRNPCDFIAFTGRNLFLIECKSHNGTSIPFDAIPQYERLLEYKNMNDVYPGILIWFKDKDLVIWVPIETAEKIYNEGHKSIQVKMINNENYVIYTVPSVKKRIYLDVDYSKLPEFCKGVR